VEWMSEGVCTQVHPDIFFAEPTNLAATGLAKKACGMCPVVDKCLQYALENREQHGIWGGLTVGERQALLRKFKIPRKK